MSTESYIGQQFKVNRKSFTVERIIAEGKLAWTRGVACIVSVSRFRGGVRSLGFKRVIVDLEECYPL